MKIEDFMKYKNFGIYTNRDKIVVIIMSILIPFLYIVDISKTSKFYSMTNAEINTILYFEYLRIKKDQVEIVNLNKEPHILDGWGYLGLISENDDFQNKLRKYIWEIKDL